MPKIKTNKTAAKRFRKKTATGKVLRGQSNTSHNTAKRSPKRMRQLRGSVVTKATGMKAIARLLPYL